MAGGLILSDLVFGGAGKQALGPAATTTSSGTPSFGHVLIYERDNPERGAYAWLGETVPTPSLTGGGQDWQEIALPFKRSILVWRGSSLLTLQLPIVMQGPGSDEHDSASYVATQIAALAQMWRKGDGSSAPPVVRLKVGGAAVPYFDLNYVLQDPGWGDAVATVDTLQRYQQHFTLTLLEFVSDQRVQNYTVRGPQKATQARAYTVKAGDTLTSIAKKLKVKGGWQALGRVQRPTITDPRRVRTGQKLTLAGLTLG